MAKEIAALKPFDVSPSREPVEYDMKVVVLWDNTDLNGYKNLLSKKKVLYREHRTP